MFGFAILPFIALALSILKKNVIPVFLLFFILWCVAGLRNASVGTDTYNYEYAFKSLSTGGEKEVEPLWKLLNLIIGYTFGNFQVFLFAVQGLILFPIYHVAKKLNLNLLLTLFFFICLNFFAYSLNIMRQSVAVSISLLFLYNLYNGNKKFALIWCLASILFHYSAAVTLIYWFINRIPIGLPLQLAIVLATIGIGIFIPGELFGYILMYAYEDYATIAEDLGNFAGNLYFLLILNLFYLFVYWIDGEKGVFFKAFFLFVIVSNLLIRIPFGMRVITYFAMVQVIYFPYLLIHHRLSSKLLVFAVLVLYSLAMYWMNFGFGEIFPYRFFFEN